MTLDSPLPYDALLVVSFGGPEGPDEVLPFLENVLRGRNVPRERMLAVADHYQHFGGISPINQQNRQLIEALKQELQSRGIQLPIYWGNRNWHPLLTDTVQQMADDGIGRALAFFTSAYSSYSGCRQYRENLIAAQGVVGPSAPAIDKIRAFYNHPGFIAANADRVRTALSQIPEEGGRRTRAELVFTAHSIPMSMADSSRYVVQLQEACRLVSAAVERAPGELVFQSRSGPPTQPWLEPDIGDHVRTLVARGVHDVVVSPIGFISDHLEVLYDLDTEARQIAESIGLHMVRAGTAGTHPAFIAAIRELIEERLGLTNERRALGTLGPSHDVCPLDCCPAPQRSGPPSRP